MALTAGRIVPGTEGAGGGGAGPSTWAMRVPEGLYPLAPDTRKHWLGAKVASLCVDSTQALHPACCWHAAQQLAAVAFAKSLIMVRRLPTSVFGSPAAHVAAGAGAGAGAGGPVSVECHDLLCEDVVDSGEL